jgi:hypothetical protein
VTAVKIVQVSPLRAGGQITSPDSGVVILLEDSTKRKWLSEGGGIPEIGSWLIHDEILKTDYVVTENQFATLFLVANE